jgi:hypothetical protein
VNRGVKARIDSEHEFSKVWQPGRLRDSCTSNKKNLSPGVGKKQALWDCGQTRSQEDNPIVYVRRLTFFGG